MRGEDRVTGSGDRVVRGEDRVSGSGDRVVRGGDRVTRIELRGAGMEDRGVGLRSWVREYVVRKAVRVARFNGLNY